MYIYIHLITELSFFAQVEDPVLDDRPGLALPLGGHVRSTAPTAA